METVRQEMELGVNYFLQLAGIANATYYRRVWALLAREGIPASPSTVYRLMKRFGRLQQSPRRRSYLYSPPPRPERMGLTVGLDFTRWG